MVKRLIMVGSILLLTGCAGMFASGTGQGVGTPQPDTDTGMRPPQRPAIAPPSNARTVEEFDTTTEAERRAAIATTPAAGGLIGLTIASLGAPTEPGFWLKTPLVSTAQTGRVTFPDTGKSVEVDLIPIEGEASAGSRISLAAMRLLGAPLTGLPQLQVYRN